MIKSIQKIELESLLEEENPMKIDYETESSMVTSPKIDSKSTFELDDEIKYKKDFAEMKVILK